MEYFKIRRTIGDVSCYIIDYEEYFIHIAGGCIATVQLLSNI